jgi:O-antigen/teichoic acid export membrane protein
VSLLWAALSITALLLVGPQLTALLYTGTPDPARIGLLAGLLAFSLLFDPLYNLVLIALQSRRQMRALAIMQNLNQLVLTVCLAGAALIDPEPETMVAGRLLYSALTFALAVAAYLHLRDDHAVPYPPPGAVLRRAVTVSYRPYWRFGLLTAVDKNLARLMLQIPLQLTGIHAGVAAAGHLQLALRGIQQAGLLTSAVFDNLAAVVPAAVGRGDYARLWRNFRRVLLVLAIGALLFYGAVALLAPLLIVPVFGAEWEPALPLIAILALFGMMTTIGGVFGPLYRAFDQMRAAVLAKIAGLLPLLAGPALIAIEGAAGGAWLMSAGLLISVTLTAAFTLPELRRRAIIAPEGIDH